MRILILLLSLLFLCPHSWAGMVVSKSSSSESNQEYGYTTTVASGSSATTGRCIPFTTGAGAFTARYVNFYTKTTDEGTDGTFQGYIMSDDSGSPGTQVGTCTPATALVDGADEEWNVAAFSAFSLSSSTDYWVCVVYTESIEQYFVTGSSGDSYYGSTTTCGDDMTSASSRQVALTVSNYSAR